MKQGLNSTQMLRSNRTLVFQALLERGSMTRSDLAKESGLQKATITNIINDFFELGIAGVDGDSASGRRGEKIRLQLDGLYTMSLGITRKDYQIAVYSLGGRRETLLSHRFAPGERIRTLVMQMCGEAADLQRKFGSKRFLGYVLAVPGPYMYRKNDGQEIFQVSDFSEWNELNVRELLEGALGKPVEMVHDAKLSAYAEWRNAPEVQDNPDSSLIVLRSRGYGIGAGIVVRGKILPGQVGMAGEIGHMGLNINRQTTEEVSYESVAGTDSAVKYMLERLYEFPDSCLNDESNYAEIVQAYRKQDPLALAAIGKMAWMLGYGIVNIIYMINPDVIILGQDYPEDEAFLEQVRRMVASNVHPLVAQSQTLRCSHLSEDSFLLGGYYYLAERLCSDLTIFDRIRSILAQCQNH